MPTHRFPAILAALTAIAFAGLWAPGTHAQGDATPKWSKRLQLSDGRTFVSDGAIALDSSFADVAALDNLTSIPPAAVEKYFKAAFTSEIRASDLTARGSQYLTPEGIPVSGLYIDYLRRKVGRDLRLRITGDRQPILLMLDDRPIGVVMPMAK
jgi:hypothetical protein